jgi:hypothetical protein
MSRATDPTPPKGAALVRTSAGRRPETPEEKEGEGEGREAGIAEAGEASMEVEGSDARARAATWSRRRLWPVTRQPLAQRRAWSPS